MKTVLLPGLMIGLCIPAFAQTNADACAKLAALKLTNATITSAQVVEAGKFAQPGATARRNAPDFKDLPAFCRVAATLTPSADSDIKIEVWLPVANWNGKLMAVGNGGWSGAIGYAALGRELSRGYAAASTDTGHTGPSACFWFPAWGIAAAAIAPTYSTRWRRSNSGSNKAKRRNASLPRV